jgi:eukaryotic-like serine/threonine-protein kinase
VTEREIFFEALEIETPEARAAYLQGACGRDATLRRKVDELLKEHFSNDSLIAGPALEGERTAEFKSPTPAEAPAQMLGRYKLLEKIGEGGFGEVWMAEQREPVKRRVALKIIKLGMDSRQIVARFEAERQALAMMDHPNIAKIFDAGTTESIVHEPQGRARHSVRAVAQPSGSGARRTDAPYQPPSVVSAGRPYFVMELVRGIKITEYCDQNQLPTQERLRLFILVCQAIQHAHQKGVIHRDIKPSNILVTLHDGVPVPKVIDFGIAKATQQELTDKTVFTQFQQFIGTPAYISPEQAEMSGLDIDTRADIYSLGVLLYELLVGQTPFDAKEMMQGGLDALRQIIREKEPLRPSTRLNTLPGEARTTAGKRRQTDVGKLVHQLQGDLDWIVMKCLEKDRTRRYETANGLANDIQRHLNNEAVLACPPSAAYRFQKAFRRNKLVFAAGTAVVLALVVGLGLAAAGLRQAMTERNSALAARAGEEVQRREAQRAQTNEVRLRREAEVLALAASRRAYASDMNIAKQALDDNNLGRALDMLDQHRPMPGQTDLRGWEWRYLWSQTRSDALFTLCQESTEIRSLSVSSDGNLVAASVDGRGGLSLWSVPDRREVLRLAQNEQKICAVISPTEPLVAFTGIRFEDSGKQRSSLRLWNLATRQMIAEKALDGECRHLAMAADGGTLVTVTRGDSTTYTSGGHITLWRLPEVTELRSYPLPDSPGFAVTPDLRLVAVSVKGIRVVELEDGRELWNKKFGARTLAFSPDGKLLAGGGDGEDILVWEVATGQEIDRLVGHKAGINSLVFWPDGKKLASASSDRTIRIWDIPTATCVDTLRGHRKQVGQVALMPDHQTLVSGCRDGSVCLWDTSVNHPRRPRIDIRDSALAWAFEADSKSVVTFNRDGRVTRWKGGNFELPEPLLETGAITNRSGFKWCFSSDGRRLGLGSDGLVEVWDLPHRSLWQRLTNSNGLMRAVKFFAGGNRLLTLSVKDQIIDDWDLTTGSKVQSWQAPADILHYALSPDERYCVIMGYGGDVALRDLTDKITTYLDIDIRKSHDGNYSPDGRWVAVPSSLGFARIWDAATWRVEKTLGGFFSDVWGAAFLPDGSRLAVTGGGREAMRLYDTSTWLETLTLEAEEGSLWPTMISPDGNVIGAGSLGGGRLQLWRAPSWGEIKEAEAKARIKQP